MGSQVFFQLISLFFVIIAGPLIIFLLVFSGNKL
uniref:Photosystem II protein psb30 n=1 Tax=Boodleopsis sp. H.0758 TaxID=2320802 RepID=A0A386AZU7_9CHLO|nr:photosystem II protein psb30 [Boodleopsis sp. H.0758]AYC64970.1 photosystem II protein psb30 [Boodleopsis sp. H.0758]